MTAAWTRQAAWFAGVLFLAAIAGWQLGGVVAWLAAAGASFVGWQLFNLYLLEAWLARGAKRDIPEAGSGWGPVYYGVKRMRLRGRDRKRRLKALVRSFRDLAAALPDGVVVLNDQYEVAWANKAGRELLQIRKGRQDRGQRITNLVRQPTFVEYIENRDFTESVEVLAPADNTIKLLARIIPYAQGQHMLVLRDVTRTHRVEKMRRNFVANVSHELRTPLTVVIGYLEAMDRDAALQELWGAQVREMCVQTDRMQSIVIDLLTLSRLESGTHEAESEIVPVPGLLAQIRKEMVAQYGNGPTIEFECESSANLVGAKNELYSAFSNLAGNAMKYTACDGRVVMNWRDDASGALFSVTDTGAGIPEEHLPRLTERFYRVDKGRSRGQGGTGLGLAIVKHALQRHDATLEIDSEPGRGSTFACRFPSARVVQADATSAIAGSGSG